MKHPLLLVLLVCPLLARAQQPGAAPRTSADSAFLRARELVVGGNGTAGRAIVDSLLAAARPGTAAYAQALYWRASLASSAATAERDYQRLVVDYPLAPHAADALYALAQLETSRGDRAGAARHLERLLLEHPEFPERARAGLSLGRLLLALDQMPKGCAVLARTRAGVPATQVELLNQIDYYAQRCQGVDTTSVVATAAKQPSARRPAAESTGTRTARAEHVDSSRRTRTDAKAQPERTTHTEPEAHAAHAEHAAHAAHESTRYTVQVAAYDTESDAERLVKRLRARGMDARVVGTAKPFRVRLGRFDSRGTAVAEQRQLKTKGIDSFVTTEPEAR